MKYVAEQDRKFTDMGGVKIHHSIYPVVYPVGENGWSPVIKFDNKHILAGGQEVQSFVGSPVLVIRILISGTIAYYDSTGYRTVLTNNDILSVNTGNELLQSVLNNADEAEDSELIEIWLESGNFNRKYEFHSDLAKRGAGRFCTLTAPEQGERQKIWLRVGSFAQGDSYEINDQPDGCSVLLFVVTGLVNANSNKLAYRDTAFFCGEAISLEFESAADIFLLVMGTVEINKEAIK